MTYKQTFIIPLIKENDIWSFVHPFSFKVWILIIFSIPIYALLWGLLNFFISRKANWSTLVGFLLRNILVDHSDMKMPDNGTHQKALTIGWIWFTFVITCSYAGNLMAQITRPSLVMPIRIPVDLLTQNEISLVMEDGTTYVDYIRESPPGSTMRMIYDKVELWDPSEGIGNGCFPNGSFSSGRHASLCNDESIKLILHKNFKEKKQCDWYLTETHLIDATNQVMLFQVVWKKFSLV